MHLVGFYYKNKARNPVRERETAGHQRKIKRFGQIDQKTEQTMESGSRGKKR